MTNIDREIIIQNAIRGYKQAQQIGDRRQIENAINDMENTFTAVCLCAVEGTEELRQLIFAARG